MVFSSLLFMFRFLPVILMVYYAVPKRFRNGVLFIGSLIFYGWGEPVYVTLLLFSTVVDFLHGKMIRYCRERGKSKAAAMGVVISSAVINLGLLGFFKYSDFMIGTINHAFGMSIHFLNLALPVGISFYTFQTMSYTIDVYRGEAEVQDDLIAFGAYVSMFPQLIAGPIVRYHTIADELGNRTECLERFAKGVRYFVIGLGKKVLIANNIGALWNEIYGIPDGQRTVLLVWVGIFAFGMQIYYDFSGYSDMAVGLGHMLGFHFPENFNYPYLSKSITEFWSRWHISLSTWFKEYVYIPLGGNKKGMVRHVCNILIVWLLTGIWHGAGWNFLLWGLYFGVLLLLEKFILKAYLQKLPGIFGWGYAMVLVYIGWVLFAHDELSEGIVYLKQMFFAGGLDFAGRRTWYLLMTNLSLIAVSIIGAGNLPLKWYRQLLHHPDRKKRAWAMGMEALGMFLILVLATAYLVDAGYNPFLYFRF